METTSILPQMQTQTTRSSILCWILDRTFTAGKRFQPKQTDNRKHGISLERKDTLAESCTAMQPLDITTNISGRWCGLSRRKRDPYQYDTVDVYCHPTRQCRNGFEEERRQQYESRFLEAYVPASGVRKVHAQDVFIKSNWEGAPQGSRIETHPYLYGFRGKPTADVRNTILRNIVNWAAGVEGTELGESEGSSQVGEQNFFDDFDEDEIESRRTDSS
ncbi:hypothetical protein M422DRAFT_50085 [Sphaerobolus stellatus SS14]|uniref:Uncharacterized protein n=1 Tax=Sphaerobolus stellatus (strain SS14) TaxID=990650 RepID=A0A0C9U610_SPHS4|nr:hypothetical protein M422DRAFT_50085 [Sphaerobolus stellatus SS14]